MAASAIWFNQWDRRLQNIAVHPNSGILVFRCFSHEIFSERRKEE